MADQQIPSSRAINACLTCRKQKRKCTKERPKCSICRKTGRVCDYTPIGRSAATATDNTGSPDSQETSENAAFSSRSTHLGGYESSATAVGSSITNGLSTLFLDSDVPQDQSYLESNRHISLPPEYIRYLRSPAQFRHEVDVYFNSVHTFFPIVSKLRLYQQLSNADRINDPDLGLLLIAMQLHTRSCSEVESGDAELYRSAKACYVYVESSNVFSIKVLQALLLIALYEISNAIYPTAYLTVGHCARLGHAMGVHQRSDAPQMLNRVGTWVELEERRRTWWAVIILDRYVNLGGRNRPLACEDAQPEDLLPADDKSWDRGEITVVEPLAVRANTTIEVCPFTRTCQAAHVLTRVLGHLNDRNSDVDFRYEEAMQLHRTAQALSHTLSNELEQWIEKVYDPTAHLPLFSAMGICYSASLLLYDRYCCSGISGVAGNVEVQQMALSSINEASRAVLNFAKSIRLAMDLGGALRMCPLVLDCLYQAAANFMWQSRETGNSDFLNMANEIQNVLEVLGARWKAPRAYLSILRKSGGHC
ncbi:fungal-specific transcription factor domain-containing protein [Aspergillus pseudocaelatus]|uniref:Fungal-specific transcription factor domain-containing protein n=1 Tax=Aspergillus pseudocaelatus TaxID=1825620 RepID=A0ABQ6X3S7_9EURO|nr:fungal-specific transcription factor domain-containing protein [Aspergillus pseudocaelatus]